MKMLKNLFALGLLSACTLVAAQWQWLDKDGRKVFSDRAPPPDILEASILKRPVNRSAPVATAADADSPAAGGTPTSSNDAKAPKVAAFDKDLETKKKQAAEAEAAKKKAEEEKIIKARIENCAQAKQAKANLDSGARIGRMNAAGEREVMDDAARAAEGKRIQGILATSCS